MTASPKHILKHAIWAIFMLTMFSTQLWAQCPTWCTTAQDVCCDGNGTITDYVLPCTTSVIWAQYDIPTNDRVFVEMTNLSTGAILYNQYLECDCIKKKIWSDALSPIAAGITIRFKVSCDACTANCTNATATVRFFTPTSTCAPNCNGS